MEAGFMGDLELKNSSFGFGFLRAVVNLAGACEGAALPLEQHTGERRKQEHRQHRRTDQGRRDVPTHALDPHADVTDRHHERAAPCCFRMAR
jgi:hypothetical protein